MIKYFHELTKEEFDELVKQRMIWAECAKKYPQPKWCNYPEAVCAILGCWSLTGFKVTGEDYCKDCDCYIKTKS